MWAGLSNPEVDVELVAFMAAMMSDVAGNATDVRDYYIHDATVKKICPNILADFAVPKFFANDWLQRFPPVLLAPNGKDKFGGLSDHGTVPGVRHSKRHVKTFYPTVFKCVDESGP